MNLKKFKLIDQSSFQFSVSLNANNYLSESLNNCNSVIILKLF